MAEFGHEDAQAALTEAVPLEVARGKLVYVRRDISGAELHEAIEASRAPEDERLWRIAHIYLANADGSRRFPVDVAQTELDALKAWPVRVLVAIAEKVDSASDSGDIEGN